MAAEKFYVTTPIYYVNADPHLGHAYTTVVADTVARFKRLLGYDVFFLTGTDEHGQKVERSAAKLGITPKALADRVVHLYHQLWPRLSISHDRFIRTTDEIHERGALKMFHRMKEAGDIYKGTYEGWYCTSCESFYPEVQLLPGRLCPQDEVATEWLSEDSYFFRLSAYQDRLLELYEKNPDFVRPETRLAEVRSFVQMGLKDLSVSRTSFRWGIPIPEDDGHVIYVWIDALSNYITALGYADDDPAVDRYWPADVHLVGKEILRHHAVYWPAMLMSAGIELPRTIYAHGWWLRDDRKMSKSKGNIADPWPLLRTFGADALRYFLLREMTFGQDSSYSDEALLGRYNSDLANDLGNLASRLLRLVEKNAPEGLPALETEEIRPKAEESVAAWRAAFDDYSFRAGLEAVFSLVAEANRHLMRKEPWKTGDVAALAEAAEALRLCAVMLLPVMPGKAAEVLAQFGQDVPKAGQVEALNWGTGRSGVPLTKGDALFPKIDPKAYFKEQLAEAAPEGKTEAPKKPAKSDESDTITIDDFKRVQLKTGLVLEAERVPKADRLLKLKVDIGTETRTIVAGIAATYAPEDLVGRRVILVANLQKAKIRGVESHGMLLAAAQDGNAILATFEGEVPPGLTVR